MNIIRKIQYNQFWNIGFCEQTPEELIHEGGLGQIKWLKHSYHDRWFADPFILRANKNEIVVFVEECLMESPKGIICELVIDRKTISLKERYVLMEKETHLSYPAIIRQDGKVYVYPENGASGKLNIYEYDEKNHCLMNPTCILDEAVADATIVKREGIYFMSATKFPNTQECAFLYVADSPFGPFRQAAPMPYQTAKDCSRQGGDFLVVEDKVYRPAQDCTERYGSSLNIMEIKDFNEGVQEKKVFCIDPVKGRYSLGLHTLNFADGFCVVDGYGYYKPVLGRLYYDVRRVIRKNSWPRK